MDGIIYEQKSLIHLMDGIIYEQKSLIMDYIGWQHNMKWMDKENGWITFFMVLWITSIHLMD